MNRHGNHFLHTGRLVLSLTALLYGGSAPAAGIHDIIARSGDQAPGTASGVLFDGFSNPLLNAGGEVLYQGTLQRSTTTRVGVSNDQGIWKGSALIAREGSTAPGISTGGQYSSFLPPTLNDAGQIAFWGRLTTGLSGIHDGNDAAIWRDGVLVAREGAQAPGVISGALFSFLGHPVLNARGQIAHSGSLLVGAGGVTSSNDRGIWRDNVLVAREGNQAPGTPSGALYSSFIGTPALNNAGQVAFSAYLQSGTGGVDSNNDMGIWRDTTLIAREGSQAPGTPAGALYSSLNPPVLNDLGQVAFLGYLKGASGGVDFSNNSGIWRDGTLVARKGSQAPGAPAGALFFILNQPLLNNAGQVAYLATLLLGPGGVNGNNDSGIWRDRSLVAREGENAPGTGGRFSSFHGLTMNDNGQVAFRAFIEGELTGLAGNYDSLWINGPNGDTLLVGRALDTLAGSQALYYDSSLSLNDSGQLAYKATLTNRDEAVVLFTPDLHWYRSYGSSWDQRYNWTIAQAPGAVHQVFIDPATDLTVTGPAGAVTVKHLTVGGGTGIGTLALAGGNLTALGGVEIAPTGVLTGTGVITGTVTNYGEVRAGNLTVDGGRLDNRGRIRGVASGPGLINAGVFNQVDGEIRVERGEHLRLTRTGHHNSGRVAVIGGALEVDGGFANDAGGRIQGRDAALRFNGGLSNAGELQFSFGTSDLFGAVTNESAGTIINSGGGDLTFYDDVRNDGELRTSAGGRSVFFGKYSGPGTLTGTGSNFFEGIFAPGASPALVTSSASIAYGGSTTTIMELGGLVRGAEYDAVDVTGGATLTLGGTLQVVLISPDGTAPVYVPGAGDGFLLFTAGQILGDFSSVDLPALAAGLNWLVSNDGQNYSLAVAAVPLPPAVWLLLSAVGGLLTLRRRG